MLKRHHTNNNKHPSHKLLTWHESEYKVHTLQRYILILSIEFKWINILLCLGSGVIIYICTLSISSMLSFLYLKSSRWKNSDSFMAYSDSFMAVIITLINVITINCQDTRPSFRLQLVTAHICLIFLPRSHHRNSSPESASRGININLYSPWISSFHPTIVVEVHQHKKP